MVYSCVFLLLYSIFKKSFYCYFQVTLLVHDCFDFGKINDNTRRGTDGFLIRKINKEKGEQKQLQQQQQQTSQYI